MTVEYKFHSTIDADNATLKCVIEKLGSDLVLIGGAAVSMYLGHDIRPISKSKNNLIDLDFKLHHHSSNTLLEILDGLEVAFYHRYNDLLRTNMTEFISDKNDIQIVESGDYNLVKNSVKYQLKSINRTINVVNIIDLIHLKSISARDKDENDIDLILSNKGLNHKILLELKSYKGNANTKEIKGYAEGYRSVF